MSDEIITRRLIKPKEAAEYLAISERKLWNMSKAGTIPTVRFGRTVRYDVADLDNFIAQKKSVCGTLRLKAV